eukprot:2162331-Ditylum_brightwellii.AAC.1
MQEMWGEHGEEESWGILLVDAWNAFNKVSRRAMLWNVRHIWVTGSRFMFNMYRHWWKLVLQGYKDLVMSKEGVTQGDPLAMILYALDVLLIILHLEKFMDKMGITEAQLQKWLADGSAIGAFFQSMKECYDELCAIGPPLGYHPEPDKSDALQETYVSKKVEEWVASVNTFTEMMPRQPQAAFTG